MSLIEKLLEGKFELPCSEIRLTREKGPALEIAGPGIIQLNAEGEFEYSIHVSAKDYSLVYQFGWQNRPKPGLPLPEEQFFQLTAASYLEGIWCARVTSPRSGGQLGEPGMVGGSISELRFEKVEAQTDVDRATLFLPGTLRFPVLQFTQRPEIRQSSSGPDTTARDTITRDHSSFTIGAEDFAFYHEQNHTELYCSFESGSIAKNRHRRMQEALGFALCRPVWPAAMILSFSGKRVEILYSPNQLATDFKVSYPPFHFVNLPLDASAKFFELVSAYYRKAIDHVAQDEHPISLGVSLVMQALQSYWDVQILTLGVAAEALIRTAFPDIVVFGQELKDEIEKFETLLRPLDLSVKFKNRVRKAVEPFLSPSGSDRLHTFIVKFRLDEALLQAWKKSRHPSAHGKFTSLSSYPEILQRRNKVLYLCHAIVLGFIGYSGPHTRYDLPGYPVAAWKPSESETSEHHGH